MTFEMKLKLLTGLKLAWIRSKPIFFSSGQTMAVFQFLWNSPLVSEMFTILVISGRTVGIICFRMCVGMVSNLQDLDLRLLIALSTWSSVIGVKLIRCGTSLCVV